MSQSGHSYIFLTCSQRPQQASTSSNAEPKRSLVYFPSLQSKTPTGVDGHSYIFLTYSQRPQQVSTASKAMSQSGHSYILCRGPSGQEQFSLPRPGGSGFCRIFLAYSQRPQQASTASKAMTKAVTRIFSLPAAKDLNRRRRVHSLECIHLSAYSQS